MGLEDVAMMRSMLGSVVYCPADALSAQAVFESTYITPGITYVRTLREKMPIIYAHKKNIVSDGMHIIKKTRHDRIAIIGMGVTVHEALKVHAALAYDHIAVRVIDVLRVAPFDRDLLRRMIGTIPHVIVAEDHFGGGGIGEAVALAHSGCRCRIVSLCVKKMPCSGTAEELRAYEKIDFNAMMDEVYLINKRYDR